MNAPPPARLAIRYSTRDFEIAFLHDLRWVVIPLCAPSASTPNGCTGRSRYHMPRCHSPGKVPLVAGYGDYARELPSLDQILRDYGQFGLRDHGDVNTAVVVPAGHVVVEADSDEADAELRAVAGGVTTWSRAPRPGRGHAFFLALPAGGCALKSSSHRGRSRAIDVKGAGSICVIADSVHATGHRYTWAMGCAPWECSIAEIPDELLALISGPASRGSGAGSMPRPTLSQASTAAEQASTAQVKVEAKRSDSSPPLLAAVGGDRAAEGCWCVTAAAMVDDSNRCGERSRRIAGAESSGEEVSCPIVAPHLTPSPSSSLTETNLRNDSPSDLLRRLNSTARKIATEGFVDGKSPASRSEMRLVIAIAALFAGADRDAIDTLLRYRVPNAFRVDDHRSRDYVIGRDVGEAECCFDEAVENAIRVRFYTAYVSRTKLLKRDVAQVRATLCFAPADGGQQIKHDVAIRLGWPALNEHGGEWSQALVALPHEPLLHRAEKLLVEQEARAWQRGEIFRRAVVPGRRTECWLATTESGVQHLLPLDVRRSRS